MEKRYLLILTLLLGLVPLGTFRSGAQQDETRLRVVVNLVQLNVAVTNNKGNYVTGLHPQDFAITEDGIPQNIATFEEGNGPTTRLLDITTASSKNGADESASALGRARAQESASGSSLEDPPETLSSAVTGANVFILFDTSNYMYRGFVFAQDAIADFVRSLERADKVAFYSYSRDLYRAAALTSDRSEVVRGVRTSVAGDDAALYNSLLLTVQDAGQRPGRKVIVVFSNGPDNSSMVPPEDVAELAQSAGIPIYMISTTEAQLEPVSTAVFDRMSAATGGKAYFAKSCLFVQLLSQAESQSRMALHQSTTRRRPLEEVSRPDEERISSQTEPVFYRQCASRVCAELIQQNRANVDIWKQLSSLPFYQAILIPSLATLSQAFHSGPGGH